MKYTPKYQHDCVDCIFLGNYNEYDLYYCNKSNLTVIARFGDDSPDYLSGMIFAITGLYKNPPECEDPLTEALKRALRNNLVKIVVKDINNMPD